jgi:predicted transposase/invertase (TIGR01784 family)
MDRKYEAMSPLADPVVGAIFSSVESAGLAAQSLVGSILAEDGVKIGKVKSVTPQRYYRESPLDRGCRVDILVESGNNENTLIEVQMSPEPIMARNLFEYAQMALSTVKSGTPTYDIGKHMPKIVVINICDFELRKNENTDFIQPVKQMYTKNPEVAQDFLNIYNVLLPKFRAGKHDLSKPLNAWLTLFDTANRKHISIEEVIDMFPELGNTVKSDPGINQFVGQYNVVSQDKITRSEYDMYLSELFRISGIRQYAYEEGENSGVEKGIEKGIELEKFSIARKSLKIGLAPEQVAELTNLPIETIRNLKINP